MAYTPVNLLEKIIAIQEIYQEYHNKGVTDIWIYENLIRPNYYISSRTFYNYLTRPAKRELKGLQVA